MVGGGHQEVCSDCEAYGLQKHGLTRSDCTVYGSDFTTWWARGSLSAKYILDESAEIGHIQPESVLSREVDFYSVDTHFQFGSCRTCVTLPVGCKIFLCDWLSRVLQKDHCFFIAFLKHYTMQKLLSPRQAYKVMRCAAVQQVNRVRSLVSFDNMADRVRLEWGAFFAWFSTNVYDMVNEKLHSIQTTPGRTSCNRLCRVKNIHSPAPQLYMMSFWTLL